MDEPVDGTMTTAGGVPSKAPSTEFALVGGLGGEFGQAAVKNRPYFDAWMARLQAGQGAAPQDNSSAA